MKKNLLLAGLVAVCTPIWAADTLFVHAPQIPLLINQSDNVLFEFRMDADKGDVLNEISIEFDQETNLADIESVRLFYSGRKVSPGKEHIMLHPIVTDRIICELH